ncbi:MAG: polyprenyl synthetase family protein [Oleiphilaceae bacterium]|nr:polyprenyl synthetase family protein [Oleiphilaceae bacterium]
MSVETLYQPVQEDFARVNQLISEQLSSHVPMVERIAHHIVDSGGKRLRPLLVLLSARALGYQGQDHQKLATVIEFLHTATLLHDDVVDTSDLRRGRTTANARWGNAPSVLVGDFLYSRAFQMMVSLNSLPIMSVLSDATAVIAEGEVMQLMNVKNPDLTEAQYLQVIHSKTAMLFQAASQTGAMQAGASPEQESALRDYGQRLGMAFQLVDDMLDYRGDARTMGKNLGDDLAEGKATLPLIQAMKSAPEADRKLIRDAIRQGGLDQLERIGHLVETTGALDYTLEKAREAAGQARDALADIPDSPFRDSLLALAELSVSRVA